MQGATDFEMARYTVVDGSHLQIVFNKPHVQGATVAMGGLCGYLVLSALRRGRATDPAA